MQFTQIVEIKISIDELKRNGVLPEPLDSEMLCETDSLLDFLYGEDNINYYPNIEELVDKILEVKDYNDNYLLLRQYVKENDDVVDIWSFCEE
jgi:hypothetical protein